MIEIKVHPVVKTVAPKETSNLLLALNNLLDKTRFFGTIELTYDNGRLVYVKTQQKFTVDGLAKYLTE
jgi:hypothetical protein